jgi:TetR/AcrR family transcriptional repressor of mexJK operon
MQDAKTPPTTKARSKRDAILTAALTVFVREGYAASVDQVAAEAGVSKQTVYSHFGSKERLFRACIEGSKRDVHDELDSATDLDSALRVYARAVLERVCSAESIAFQRLLVAQAASFPEAARIYDEAGPAHTRARLATFMARWIEARQLRADEPARLAEDFLALLIGTRRQRLMLGLEAAPNEAEIGELSDHAVDVFLRAYRSESANTKVIVTAS